MAPKNCTVTDHKAQDNDVNTDIENQVDKFHQGHRESSLYQFKNKRQRTTIQNSNKGIRAANRKEDHTSADKAVDKDADSSTGSSLSPREYAIWSLKQNRTPLIVCLILSLGMMTSAAFLSIGISGANHQLREEFQRNGAEIVGKIQNTFEEYVYAASIVHGRCRYRDFTRDDFRELYLYLHASGLNFKAVQFDPNITHKERYAYEQEAKDFYAQNYPHINYEGFRGFNTLNSTTPEPRTNQSFYFPIHYMEPVIGNEAAIGLDYYSSESRIRTVNAVFEYEKPIMTDRLHLVHESGKVSRCGNHNGPSYGVVLMHPGVDLRPNVTNHRDEVWPRDISSLVICIPDLLVKATLEQGKSSNVYIHDLSHPHSDAAVFMGGVHVDRKDDVELKFLDEASIDELIDSSRPAGLAKMHLQQTIEVANRLWAITICEVDNTYNNNTVPFVIAGGIMIFLASVAIALWVWHNARRVNQYNQLKNEADADRARLILENAQHAAKAERELNDFIAHEVRNPVAAALAACSLVQQTLMQHPLDEESQQSARGDITIIDNSLHFVNDLLRNMLDMHRACNKHLIINKSPVDLLHDVLEPVGGMLYHQRGRSASQKNQLKLLIDCPSNVCVLADSLRLKQVLINLGRNACKFMDKGFLRLGARVDEETGHVQLFVEDSGSGIPLEKREHLFAKYQKSLDLLNQGTGIGLFLCKNLVELMDGDIYLDDSYNSGIHGCPGTRFVIDLRAAPIDQSLSFDSDHLGAHFDHQHNTHMTGNLSATKDSSTAEDETSSLYQELPEHLSVLFVDDDAILRKLFTRSVLNMAPNWTVREAASGETALRLVAGESDRIKVSSAADLNKFDLIFVDMYMASVEKSLLGTETVMALREMGVTARICGLSANDKQIEFLDAGADAFMFKPFPCEPFALQAELCRVLYADNAGALMVSE